MAALIVVGQAAAADRAQQVEVTKKKADVLEKKAAGKGGKVLPSPTGLIKKAEVQAVDPAGKGALNDPITCLSRTIYWEARGDGAAGMEAIASVVMNRLGHKGFPDDVCPSSRKGPSRVPASFPGGATTARIKQKKTVLTPYPRR